MGSDTYHLILQALVDYLHLPRLHAVRNVRTRTRRRHRLFNVSPTAVDLEKLTVSASIWTRRGVEGINFYDLTGSNSPHKEKKLEINWFSTIKVNMRGGQWNTWNVCIVTNLGKTNMSY